MKSVIRIGLSLVALLVLASCREMATVKPGPAGSMVFENQNTTHIISADGRTERFADKRTGVNYAVSNSPCARIKQGGKEFPATAAAFRNGLLSLKFDSTGVEAAIRITVKKSHFLWEVVSVGGEGVEEFVFADVPLTLSGAAGEPFVTSALAMNLKTLVNDLPQPVSRLTASCFPRFGFAGAQVALIGCLVALAGSMALMYVSYFVGPAARRASSNETREATRMFATRSSGIAAEVSRDRAA